jgi:hypothetical protein
MKNQEEEKAHTVKHVRTLTTTTVIKQSDDTALRPTLLQSPKK